MVICMNIEEEAILQGDIWMVKFHPKIGSEISKLRPAVVISHNTIGRLPLKTIVPVTDWKPPYSNYPWMFQIDPSKENGLTKKSAIDCFQIKNFANERFVEKIGHLQHNTLKEIHAIVTKTFNPNYTLL